MRPALLMLSCPVCCMKVIGFGHQLLFKANCALLILLCKIDQFGSLPNLVLTLVHKLWRLLERKKMRLVGGDWYGIQEPYHHAFIGWLAMLNRLSTKERMHKWGFNGYTKCVPCRNKIENREHLFFDCSFLGDYRELSWVGAWWSTLAFVGMRSWLGVKDMPKEGALDPMYSA